MGVCRFEVGKKRDGSTDGGDYNNLICNNGIGAAGKTEEGGKEEEGKQKKVGIEGKRERRGGE